MIESQVPPSWPGTYAPNFSDWLVGDIVLVHSAGDIPGKLIQAYQAVSACPLTSAGRMCTHVGIYVGSGMVVDTTPGVGVTERSVWSYCQTRALQLRRLEDSTISANQIADIAVKARAQLGEPYSIVQAVVSTLFPGAQPPPDALYCSTFVGLVVAQATGFLLYGDAAYQPLQPGTLAAHPELTETCRLSGGSFTACRARRVGHRTPRPCNRPATVATQHEGRVLAPMDLLIGAHAMSIDAVLVTNNRAFAQLPGLSVEDWTEESR